MFTDKYESKIHTTPSESTLVFYTNHKKLCLLHDYLISSSIVNLDK